MVSPPADFESAASAISPPGRRQVATPFLARALRGVKVSRSACAFSFPSKAMLESRRRDPGMAQVQCVRCGNQGRSEERRVGKSVDLGGRRIIKKKKIMKRTIHI